jgi:hypothetical protein
MNSQLKLLLTNAKLNFAVLAAILIIAVVGKFINPELTNAIFVAADQLVSDLYLVFISITLGAFVPNFKTVVFGAFGVFAAGVIAIQLSVFHYLTTGYLFSILIVTLGFASIANLYRHYQGSWPINLYSYRLYKIDFSIFEGIL